MEGCSNTYCTHMACVRSAVRSFPILPRGLPSPSSFFFSLLHLSLSFTGNTGYDPLALALPRFAPTYPVNKLRSRTYLRFPRHCLHGVQLHVRRARMRRMLLSPRWTAELLAYLAWNGLEWLAGKVPGRHVFSLLRSRTVINSSVSQFEKS